MQMTREQLIDLLEGRSEFEKFQVEAQDLPEIPSAPAMRPPPDTGIEPYAGEWTAAQAAHLLRRTTFGVSKDQIKLAVANGMEWTVDKLLEEIALPEPPVVFNDAADSPALGETWITEPYDLINFPAQIGHRTNSLSAWTLGLMLEGQMNIREKMTLFWHNHFATEIQVVNDPKFAYQYITTLRENATGNFRELAKLMTVDPMMLRYLNGHDNSVESPNENYARELLELFTIGKGPQVAEGDYTNYTEQDVLAFSKILTGWRARGYRDRVGQEVDSVFVRSRHDESDKTLSHRFGNNVISNGGDLEYRNAIDVIFQKAECARFIMRKLYRWFVYYDINDAEEMQVIEPLAQLLVDHDYNLKEVLRTLLMSEHFYDPLNCGCIIKSPIDFVTNLFNQFEIEIDKERVNRYYQVWLTIFRYTTLIQQQYFQPPSVAGWSAYYQAPGYQRTWTNGVTLPYRILFTDIMSLVGFTQNGLAIQIDFLKLLEGYEDAISTQNMIRESVEFVCPKAMEDNQIDFLQAALLPGLPDFVWTEEYVAYLDDPDNEELRASVDNKLRIFFRTLLLHPEYHLS